MTDPNHLPDDPLSRKILEAIDELPRPEPSPGFDRQMKARVDALDAHRPWWQRIADLFTVPRVSIAAAAGAAALLGFIVVSGPRHENPPAGIASAEAFDIAEDLDLLENFDLIEDLDVVEDIEVIQGLDEAG